MARDLEPYVGSLLSKHFTGADKLVSVEKSRVDLSSVMQKNAELGPSVYISQTIGGHPDYDHLLYTDEMEDGWITTLFADLKNFSARGLFVNPTDVKAVKRQVLGLWIDSVRIMGGHVHSIDGDGLMVFFGRRNADPAQATYDALAAGINLLTLTEDNLNPLLEDQGHDKVRVRVGVDHDPDMRWGRVGIPGHYEVKGTGFGIDFAAKMMQSRRSGFVMVGETLVDLIDVPRDFLRVHTYTHNGEEVEDRYYRRTWHSGKPNEQERLYKKWQFDFDKMFTEIGDDRIATAEDIRHICTADKTAKRNVTPAPRFGPRTHPETEEFAQKV